MKKKLLFLLLFGIRLMVCYGQTESYNLETLEGNKATIHLTHNGGTEVLAISYLNDTILIKDYWSTDTVEVLNKVFLRVKYAVRMGSNEGRAKDLIVCVAENKLHESLHVESYSNYDFRPDEYHLYELRLELTGHDEDTYKLTLHIHSEKRSKRTPAANYNTRKTAVLKFDKKNKVFFNSTWHD